jgi:hypothetical protein
MALWDIIGKGLHFCLVHPISEILYGLLTRKQSRQNKLCKYLITTHYIHKHDMVNLVNNIHNLVNNIHNLVNNIHNLFELYSYFLSI